MAQPDGSVWAKVSASEFDKTTAAFKYDDIVKAYGTDNFEKVSCICFTATDVADITVKKVTVTNCIEKGSHYVDKEEQKEQNKNNMIFTIIGIVAGIVIAVVIIVVIMNKKAARLTTLLRASSFQKGHQELRTKNIQSVTVCCGGAFILLQ